MTTRMLQRRDLASAWAAVNPILGDGEIGFVKDTGEIRIGDGVTHWADVDNKFKYLPKSLLTESVNGRRGAVVLTVADVPGVYYAGNPPPYPVTSVAGRGGGVVLSAADITTGTFPGPSYRMTSLGLGMTPTRLLDMLSGGGDAVKLSGGNYRVSGGYFVADTGYGSLYDMTSGNQGVVLGSGTTLKIRGGLSGVAIRNNADTADNWKVDDTGTVTLTNNAAFPAGKGVLFSMSSGNQGYLIGSGAVLQLRSGTGGTIIRNNADTLSLMQLNNTGDLNLHGTTAGVLLFGRDNDTQNYVNYVTGNIWRVYSSSGGADRLTIDSTGTVRIHGAGAALNLHGVDNDTNAWSLYTYQNVLRILNGTDKLLLDTNGTLTLKNTSASAIALSVDAAVNARGPEIAFLDTKAGQTTPSKFIRTIGGTLQVVNSAYTTAILIVTDAGNLTVTGTVNDSSGRVYSPGNPPPGGGTPTFHGVRAYHSAAASIPTAGAIVPLDSENYDTDAFHSTVTNTSRFTVPAGMAGKYKISGLLEWSTANGTGNRQAGVYKNGAAAAWGTISRGDATWGVACSVATTLQLAVGDYVELFAFQNSGANLNLQTIGAGVDTRFEMEYLGA